MNNKEVIEATLRYLFLERLRKARKQFSEEAKGTSLVGNILVYKGITQVYSDHELDYPTVIMENHIDPKFHNSLNRVLRITKEQEEVAEVLRFFANLFDEPCILAHFVHMYAGLYNVMTNPYEELIKEKVAPYQDKVDLLLRTKAIKEMSL